MKSRRRWPNPRVVWRGSPALAKALASRQTTLPEVTSAKPVFAHGYDGRGLWPPGRVPPRGVREAIPYRFILPCRQFQVTFAFRQSNSLLGAFDGLVVPCAASFLSGRIGSQ
jgi:hypothetical protein